MTGSHPRPGTLDIIEQVRDAVLTVPGVLGLSAGVYGEVGTYLPGRRVGGVRMIRGRCEVHVVARFGTDLAALAQTVRAALAPLVDAPVDVTIADVGHGPGRP